MNPSSSTLILVSLFSLYSLRISAADKEDFTPALPSSSQDTVKFISISSGTRSERFGYESRGPSFWNQTSYENTIARLSAKIGEPAPPIPTNAVLASQLLQAQRGNPLAQYLLGVRYLKGVVVAKNEKIGREWLLKSAKQGNNDAYQNMRNTDFSETKKYTKGT